MWVEKTTKKYHSISIKGIWGDPMIFVTGDTHGKFDIKNINSKSFPLGKDLTKKDYVIVAGDFGFIWDGIKEDEYWLKWFDKKPFTTLFVDGNHENFNLLNNYPIEYWNGGKVHKINNSVIHLMRGQIYELEGRTFFTFGGAKSSDIEYRKQDLSWWIDEMPSKDEYEEGLKNLEGIGWKVDYIITHTCSYRTQQILKANYNKDKETTEINHYFDMIEEKAKYEHWYFGHKSTNQNY